MTDHKQNPAEIFLVEVFDGEDYSNVWCDTPAPGEGMREEDATRYVREDLVPASNEVLARRIVELTETVTALRGQLASKPSDSGYAKLQKQVSEQSKVIEHIAAAVGCEDDPLSCWESVDALVAQVEQLRDLLSAGFMTSESGGKWYQLVVKMPNLDKLQQLHTALVLLPKPAQCLAEVKAQAVLPIFNKLKAAHGDTTHPRAKVYLCEEAYELAAEVMQAKAGE